MRMIPKTLLLSSSLILCAIQVHPVLADQCAYITRAQAEKFVSEVKIGDTIGSLCEPCGESPAADGSIPMTRVQSVKISPDGDGAALLINDEPIDLAYTYLVMDQTDDALIMENAAMFVACPCDGVTDVLTVPREASGIHPTPAMDH